MLRRMVGGYYLVHKEFVPAVEKQMLQKGSSVNALLFDNAPAHPDESLLISSVKTIITIFLPPNTTALCVK